MAKKPKAGVQTTATTTPTEEKLMEQTQENQTAAEQLPPETPTTETAASTEPDADTGAVTGDTTTEDGVDTDTAGGENEGDSTEGDEKPEQDGDADQEVLDPPEDQVAPDPEPAPVADQMQGKSLFFRLIAAEIDSYVKAMDPTRPQTEAAGAAQQRNLFNTISKILTCELGEFSGLLDYFLSVIEQNRDGVFSEACAYRYFPNVPLNANQLEMFRNLLRLFLVAAAPATRRQVLERVDLNKIFAPITNEEIHKRLRAYFAK